MGMNWGGREAEFVNVWQKIQEELSRRLETAMKRVIDQAVEDAKRFTASRPSRKSGKSGRVDTGEMLESIMGRTFKEGVLQIVGEFGFIDQQELYYALQTSTGFRHYLSGDFIGPTFALRDAARQAIINLFEEMKS